MNQKASTRQETQPLSGYRGDAGYFRFEERTEFDPELVLDVLRGRRLGVIFRGVIPAKAQRAITDRFWASPARRHRPGEPSHYVGSYHWNKSVETYLAESEAVRVDVENVLDVPDSPWASFRDGVSTALARHGATLRVARMHGTSAGPALIRAWTGAGAFSLAPHDDAAQCKDPRQAGFEIQRTLEHEVCAVNMCVEHEQGGRLVIWNIRPDDPSRDELGLRDTGFGYPADVLAGFDEIRLDIRQGDVYVFNGAHVHAVDATEGNRTNVSCLIGFTDDRTVVTWT
ncbi:hypothetical protein CFN78_18190 [Amycolatopsis antarctica]|uniref:Fe2OG dioxygenase domain-containing protein n=1 Tax=Amycolatopsis antarctica TaxID=1854586 RepID=A0A263D088_9PSEU|nr:hypothetical protein [Amycolatopsis antarctica]OZM71761.1 hypothetical protein CFN78_18190 [Amycolatopsis antarctica]